MGGSAYAWRALRLRPDMTLWCERFRLMEIPGEGGER